MTPEILTVFGVLLCSLILFAQERLPVDLIAVSVAVFLMLTGIVAPTEGLSGFSHPATVTVTAMFILSAGVAKTEAIEKFGLQLARLARKGYLTALGIMMLCVGTISAFVNNTATVALLIPVILNVCRQTKLSPSKLLMPLSFASLLGGMCTLIGTSTNILVSSLAKQAQLEPFSMFEFAPLGICLYLLGAFYLFTVGHRFLPETTSNGELSDSFEMAEYVTDVVVLPKSESVGKRSFESHLYRIDDLDILQVVRDDNILLEADPELLSGDILRIRCDVKRLRELEEQEGVSLLPKQRWTDLALGGEDTTLVEAVIAPSSSLVGRTLNEEHVFPQRYEALVLALRQHGGLKHEGLLNTILSAGSALLLRIRKNQLPKLVSDPDFVVVSELEEPKPTRVGTLKALLILLAVILLAAGGIVPVVVAAVTGCVAMCLTGVLTLEEAYQSIEWKVIFLLAGVLPLGIAMENTGAARLLAETLLSVVGEYGPRAVLATLFLMTSLMTALMSNNATAALLTPLAISTAHSMQIDPRPFLVAVTFGASTAFMTPMGYQTNLMIYGAGRYRFEHFLKVGTPLNILCLTAASILIPYIWPF